ncbi:MAG: BamA/TamA family outer membrane protein [Bdellovibrionales bacterium]|nr:BamA/TamA family outer membrane protein [Bdellovibrionales bacterium]
MTLSVGIRAAEPSKNIEGTPENLPFGVFPPLNPEIEIPHDTQSLGTEIKDLSKRVESTVKTLASNHNIQCFRNPCLLQAFPIAYNAPGSGFFGGARVNLSNMSRKNPRLYSLDAMFVRSDTDQWNAFASLDLPKIESLPFDPRWKIRVKSSRTTQPRYYGIGPSSETAAKQLSSEQLRYSLEEQGTQTSILVPLTVFEGRHVNFLTTFGSVRHQSGRISEDVYSKLFADQPLGYHGGISSHFGFGIELDERDRESISRHGWQIETAGEVGAPPIGQFDYRRYTLIYRGYASWENLTFASRTTFDSLDGDVPFWEMSGVGGIDPISEISSPDSLRGYDAGRFHEKLKLIFNGDLRVHLRPRRAWGQYLEPVWIPIGVDLGRLGSQTGWSLSTSAVFLFNDSFMIRTLYGYAPTGSNLQLTFGEEY